MQIVHRSVPPLQPTDEAFALQCQESLEARQIANAIACFVFHAGSYRDLPPKDMALCWDLGVLAVRSIRPKWVEFALQSAADACADALQAEMPWLTMKKRQELAESLTTTVLSAYDGILEGRVILKPEAYLAIAGGAR